MKIVDLTVGDVDKLLDFYRSLPKEVTDYFQPFRKISRDVFARHLLESRAGKHISVGILDGEVLAGHGFVMHSKEQFPVFGIGLQQRLHGKGYGRRLMGAVITRSNEQKLKRLTLTVLKNNTKAFTMYQSFGFKIKAEHTFRKRNDSYLMERKTGDTIV